MLAFTGLDRREGPGRLSPTVGALGERLFGVPFLLPQKKPQKEKHLGAFEGVQPIPDGRGEKALGRPLQTTRNGGRGHCLNLTACFFLLPPSNEGRSHT